MNKSMIFYEFFVNIKVLTKKKSLFFKALFLTYNLIIIVLPSVLSILPYPAKFSPQIS